MPSNKKLLQAAAGNAGGDNLYVEDVFSTYLYTGNDSTGTTEQQITNGIDLDGEGGMVWMKSRDGARSHCLYDTERGNGNFLASNTTAAALLNSSSPVWRPTSTGFYTGRDYGGSENQNLEDIVSWSFRKQAGFFDVVTYTGDGTGPREIAHNLGCKPGCIIIKNLDQSYGWAVWVKSFDLNEYDSAYILLNTGDASTYTGTPFVSQLNVGSRDPSANFYVKNDSLTNANGIDYVAYLFADGDDAAAQVFGDDGDENIIKCGSYTGNGSADGPTIDCGFEPQWLLIRNTSNGGNWVLMDAMRGMPVGDEATVLLPNASGNESGYANLWGVDLQATGFKVNVSQIQINESGGTMIYIAIRRPMKNPEAGTEVFQTVTYTGNGSTTDREIDSGKSWKTDLHIHWNRTYGAFNAGASSVSAPVFDSLRGYESSSTSSAVNGLATFSTAAESSTVSGIGFKNFPDFTVNYTSGNMNQTNIDMLAWQFKRATGFMDVVAYTGNSVEPRAIAHGLGVVPEMIIIKNRSGAYDWVVYHSGNTANPATQYLHLNANYATLDDDAMWKDTAPTASVFTTGNALQNNISSYTYIAYLFATLAGVSKVGSYTGTGANLNVDCGFSAGARFILIKRTDSTGDWYVWDTERGIVAGNDPFLLLNSSAAEVTSTDYIDPLSSGFTVTSSAPAALNASGGDYIFLAIA